MIIKIYGIDAAILDMDGVITNTARVHEKAWKQMLDAFLKARSTKFKPFSHEDYLKYVDGKPRYEGVTSFLTSRKIDIPYGDPTDKPDQHTACGLGNKKNDLFLDIIEKEGVEVFKDSIEQLQVWREHGLKTGVISSSKNCKQILKKAGILDLFDVRIDGEVSAEKNIKGKPKPDIFIETAKELDVHTSKTVILEDAIAGVKAGKKGEFGMVLGVTRNGTRKGLLENGADLVVQSMKEVQLYSGHYEEPFFTQDLPSALIDRSDIYDKVSNKQVAFFFDYDGTLTPIVKHPQDAFLSNEMKEAVQQLTYHFPVAVVSGRDLKDIQQLIGIDNIYYAGSHGYHIEGPGDMYMENEKASALLPLLDEIEKQLKNDLEKKIKGATIDRKKFAIAVHYRNVEDTNVERLKKQVKDIVKNNRKLKLGTGKKILEIKPAIEWHKGKAIYWLLDKLNMKIDNTFPVYIGDDITDEDAFREIIDDGVGILVAEHDQPTVASYTLKDNNEVKLFIRHFINDLKKKVKEKTAK